MSVIKQKQKQNTQQWKVATVDKYNISSKSKVTLANKVNSKNFYIIWIMLYIIAKVKKELCSKTWFKTQECRQKKNNRE